MIRTVNLDVDCRPVDRAITVKREEGERAPITREEGTKIQKRMMVRATARTVMFTIRNIPAFPIHTAKNDKSPSLVTQQGVSSHCVDTPNTTAHTDMHTLST